MKTVYKSIFGIDQYYGNSISNTKGVTVPGTSIWKTQFSINKKINMIDAVCYTKILVSLKKIRLITDYGSKIPPYILH